MMIGYLFDFFFGHSVSRDDLGHLGGNPRFRPPPYMPEIDIKHGIPPGSDLSSKNDRKPLDAND